MRAITTAITLLLATLSHAGASESPPNIIYILADDLGWKDVGYHGGQAMTPNIDTLANNGARLEKFYTLPYSSSSRAALMTGRYPMRFGLQMMSILPWNSYGVPPDERLLPEALREAGYTTAAFGEWRLGHAQQQYLPNSRGFDYFFGSLNKGRNHFKDKSNINMDWWLNSVRTPIGGYDSEVISEQVRDYMGALSGQKPFFLYISFPNPASPFEAPEKFTKMYVNVEDEDRRNYLAMVSALDLAIGEIISKLDDLGFAEQTLIIFHSDNGGAVRNKYKTGDGDVAKAVADNGPLFNGKGSLYEGGIRVPALLYWPTRIKPQMTNELVHITDMYTTLLKVGRASLESNKQVKPVDGLDARPVIFDGSTSSRSEVLVNVDEFRGALILDNWKLIVYASLPGRVELYNIQDDPTEENNRSKSEPKRLKEMLKRFTDLAWEMSPSEYLRDLSRPHKILAPVYWRNNPTRP